MTPEIQQYLIYGGLIVAGIVLRHFGVSLPGMPVATTPPTSPGDAPPQASPPRNNPTNGTETPLPSKSILDAIDLRLSSLENRLASAATGGGDSLAAQLASLSHRLLDKKETTTTPV